MGKLLGTRRTGKKGFAAVQIDLGPIYAIG